MYGIVPPPCDQMKRMSRNFVAVLLSRTLSMVTVVSVDSTIPIARRSGNRLLERLGAERMRVRDRLAAIELFHHGHEQRIAEILVALVFPKPG